MLMGQLWWVFVVLVEGVLWNYIELGILVKMLFGQFDCQFKNSIDIGVKVGELVFIDLLKNLLFYVVGSEGEIVCIGCVKEVFCLDSVLLLEVLLDGEQCSLFGLGKLIIVFVVIVLLEELGGIKEILDLFMWGDVYNIQELWIVILVLKQVLDILVVLGVGNLCWVIVE